MKDKEDVTSNGKLFNKFLLMFQSKSKEGIKSKRQLLKGLPEEDDTSKAVNEVVQYVTNHPDEASEILQTILNKDEISNDVFKEASIELSKDDKVPNTAIVDAVKESDIDVPDNIVSSMINEGDFGRTTGQLLEQINDEKVKQLNILRTLDEIYCKCDKYQSDEKLLDSLRDIGLNGKGKEQDTEVNMWIRKIISKRMASNFSKFGFSKVFVFSDYYSPEKMIEMDFSKDVMKEYDKLKVKGEKKNIEESDVVDAVLDAVSTNVAKNYQETGSYIIPQIKNLNEISEEEEEKFIHHIASKSKRELTKAEINNIKNQIHGKIRNKERDKAIFNKFVDSGIIDLMERLSDEEIDGAIKAIKESLERSISKCRGQEKVEDDESDREAENHESDR